MARRLNKSRVDEVIKFEGYEEKTLICQGEKSDVEIVIYPFAKFEKRVDTLMRCMRMIWGESSSYSPGITTFAYGYAILNCFTNVKTDDLDQMYEFIHGTEIVKKVEAELPKTVLRDFKHDFNDAMEYYRICKTRSEKADELYDSILSILNSFGEVVSNINVDEIKPVFDGLKVVSDNTITTSEAEDVND